MAQQLLLALFFWLPALCLAQFSDDFSDGDLSNNPTWMGDINDFEVTSDKVLQLNAASAGSSVLYVPAQIPDSAIWEIHIRLDFAPSGSNQLRIFLQSTQSVFDMSDAYFIEIGESGSNDALKFFRRDQGADVLLASGTAGAVGGSVVIADLRVMRTAGGNWQVFADYNNSGSYELEAAFQDDTFSGGNQVFGIQCDYTDSRKDRFFFDDILIDQLVPDTDPPMLQQAAPLSSTSIEVGFDELLDPISASDIANFKLHLILVCPLWQNRIRAMLPM